MVCVISCHLNGQVEGDELEGYYHAWKSGYMRTKCRLENLKGRDYFKYVGLSRSIILKGI